MNKLFKLSILLLIFGQLKTVYADDFKLTILCPQNEVLEYKDEARQEDPSLLTQIAENSAPPRRILVGGTSAIISFDGRLSGEALLIDSVSEGQPWAKALILDNEIDHTFESGPRLLVTIEESSYVVRISSDHDLFSEKFFCNNLQESRMVLHLER